MKDPDKLWFDICNRFKIQSKCKSRQVGCIIVKNNHQIMQGWNGAPYGSSCDECERPACKNPEDKNLKGKDLDKAICSHSEANAIGHCARYGISTDGSVLYCTTLPCPECAKLIIAAGIKEVVYSEDYPIFFEFSLKLFQKAGIIVRKFVI